MPVAKIKDITTIVFAAPMRATIRLADGSAIREPTGPGRQG
jgi:hypothetical protein